MLGSLFECHHFKISLRRLALPEPTSSSRLGARAINVFNSGFSPSPRPNDSNLLRGHLGVGSQNKLGTALGLMGRLSEISDPTREVQKSQESIKPLISQGFYLVGRDGFEPPYGNPSRFTVCRL